MNASGTITLSNLNPTKFQPSSQSTIIMRYVNLLSWKIKALRER